jgi:hypothetical protein
MASAAQAHSLLSTPGALAPLNRSQSVRSGGASPPRVRGHAAEGTATTYWEWSKTNAPKFARPGRRPIPKGKARFLAGRDGKPLGRHVTRHDLRQELATDEYARSLGFQLPRRRPATADMAKDGNLFLPGQRSVQKRRSPSKKDRAQTPDGRKLERSDSGLNDFSLDYLVPDISFNGSRSELLPPSAPFSFMRPSGPLERERMRPHSSGAHDPTDGIYDLPRWPAFQLGGLEDSGTYASPERAGREAPRPPTPDRLKGLAKALRGPKGLHEIQATKNEAKMAEELKAKSIHKDKKPLTKERLETFAKPLKHKQGAKYVKPVEVSKWKPRKRRKNKKKEPDALTGASGGAEKVERSLEQNNVDGMELTRVVTKTVPAPDEYPDRNMTDVRCDKLYINMLTVDCCASPSVLGLLLLFLWC